MGNCLFGGLGEEDEGGGVIKVITSNGGIMEFYPPITSSSITDEFPGHAIFPSKDLFWKPLSNHQDLLPGKSYYLLPSKGTTAVVANGQIVQEGHVRSNSVPSSSLVAAASYRMSFDYHGTFKRSYYSTEAFSGRSRFWKVKLVISPEQLLEILSQEARTEELIENVRTVAKCGNGVLSASSTSSVAFSDQWSFSSSSRNASSKKDYVIDIQ